MLVEVDHPALLKIAKVSYSGAGLEDGAYLV